MDDGDLAQGRLLRRSGLPQEVPGFKGVQIDDPRLAEVLPPKTRLMNLYEGGVHAEGPVWQTARERLLWSDVPNRRLLAWYQDGHVEAAIDPTFFMNGNALMPDGSLVHCEHGRRCISRSAPDLRGEPEPIVSRFEGKRLNAPNDVAVASDGSIWFTDPIFGIVMPSQGSLADPELDHQSVYRFHPTSGALCRMADFEQPNGLAFSPGGRTLYVSDTSRSLGDVPGFEPGARHEVEAFEVAADGSLSNHRFFCHTDHGVPDGLTVDPRGWLWTSAADGVQVWSAEREKLGFIPIPVVASNLTFGGRDGRRLFIAASHTLLAIDLLA
jgi:gluconolactonase